MSLKNQKFVVFCFIILYSLAFSLLDGCTGVTLENKYFKTHLEDLELLNSSPIYITDNDDLMNYDFPGNGTKDNPYLIAGLFLTDFTTDLIWIMDTDVFINIENCTLNGVKGLYFGIHLRNTANIAIIGNKINYTSDAIHIVSSINIMIQSNIIHDNALDGIVVTNSQYIDIGENIIYSNGFVKPDLLKIHSSGYESIGQTSSGGNGILIDPSSNISIHKNFLFENRLNGIILFNSTNVELISNKIHHNGDNGLNLWNSGKNIIRDNEIFSNGVLLTGGGSQTSGGGNGILIDPSDDVEVVDCRIYANFGKGIHSLSSNLQNLSYNTIYSNGDDGIALVNSVNSVIAFNNITGNGVATLTFLYQFTPLGTLQTSGGGNGILIDPSSKIDVYNNIIADNSRNGLLLLTVSDSLVSLNSIINNNEYGIFLSEESTDVKISCNRFVGNALNQKSQARDDGSRNIFGYNFWSDYSSLDTNQDNIGDVDYNIDGTANNTDEFPIIDYDLLSECPQTIPTKPTGISVSPIFIIFGLIILGYSKIQKRQK